MKPGDDARTSLPSTRRSARTLTFRRVDEAPPSTLVWVDAREAVIVHLEAGRVHLQRVDSAVPAHHRATGHVRHDPAVRHGGGGSPQSAGEPHRIEHLNRFVGDIAERLATGDRLLVLGPGVVHERLARLLSESDARYGHERDIVSDASLPMTDRQLIARLRRFAGVEPRRRSPGALRRTHQSARGPSGTADLPKRRLVRKLPRRRWHEALEG